MQTVHLRDDIEVAARIEMDVDVGERFEASTELGPGAAHPLGHRAHEPVVGGQQRDDPIGLAELVLAQHDSLITVEPHRVILSPINDRARR